MDTGPILERLAARLRELQERAQHIGADLSAPHSADSEEAAIELENEEALFGQSALVRTEVAQVCAAIARIEDNSYGACTACGHDIAPARLAAMPEAALCISCASKAR